MQAPVLAGAQEFYIHHAEAVVSEKSRVTLSNHYWTAPVSLLGQHEEGAGDEN